MRREEDELLGLYITCQFGDSTSILPEVEMATTTSTPRPANDDDQLSSRFASREKNTLARPGRPAHTILEIRKMGSVPVPKDHILIVFIRDLPPSLIQELKADFPEHELQVHRSDPGIPVPKGQLVYPTTSDTD